jgi:PHD/YefM family antitoxin component YafN of YafNO toxin-antitoxin module
MSPTDLRQRAKRRLDGLNADHLRAADDFLAYLEDRESQDATAELLRIPGFADALRKAEEEIAAGDVTTLDELLADHRGV